MTHSVSNATFYWIEERSDLRHEGVILGQDGSLSLNRPREAIAQRRPFEYALSTQSPGRPCDNARDHHEEAEPMPVQPPSQHTRG
jgi:hypothetical protein